MLWIPLTLYGLAVLFAGVVYLYIKVTSDSSGQELKGQQSQIPGE
jgi:hypothetical protein